MELSVQVSLGEVLDKISILRIKLDRIKDAQKLLHVRNELDRLTEAVKDIPDREKFIAELTVHNSTLWDVEDQIRLKERQQKFDAEFIELARKVYQTNDKRFAVKDAANRQFNSTIREQKSYQ